MSRLLSQRLASGVGAGNVRWIKEGRTAFWEIVRKASSVNKAARADGAFGSRHQRVSFLHGLQPSPAVCDDTHDSTFSPKIILLFHSRPGEMSQVARFAWTAL